MITLNQFLNYYKDYLEDISYDYANEQIIFAKSGIKIKKKNRGKFTKSAKAAGQSVQEHAHSVMNNPNSTPLQRKRANFAIQAKRWKKKK